MPVAFTRSLDPVTQDLPFDQSRNTWLAGDPDSEALLRVFLTQKGSHVPDPDFGFDWAVVQKRATSAAADIKREAERATRRLVQQRGLTDVSIDVEPKGETVAITMNFKSRSGIPNAVTVDNS